MGKDKEINYNITFYDFEEMKEKLLESEVYEIKDYIDEIHKEFILYVSKKELTPIEDLAAMIIAMKENDYEFIISTWCNSKKELVNLSIEYYPNLPDELKFDYLMHMYIRHGNEIKFIRDEIISAVEKGYREKSKNNWLEFDLDSITYADDGSIIVYRAGEESIDETSERLSWTFSKKVAVNFYERFSCGRAKHIFKAQIKKEDVIAVISNSVVSQYDEEELLQYNKIYNIKKIR